MSCSSFHGVISEIPGISVDNFEHLDSHAYFLSHCHTDHTKGLSSSALVRHLSENNGKIYMSDVTAEIIGGIPSYYGVKKFFQPLTLGSTTTIEIPGKFESFYLKVKLLPAGHCFGSVMFLFRSPYHTILFTGDFRISINDVPKLGPLHEKNQPIHIDKMYVDTTFIDCAYDDFPKRSESVGYVIELIKDWLEKDPNNAIALHTSARFGYEYVFNEIYKQLALKVSVQDNDWAIYSKFPEKVKGVSNTPTRIHKCGNRNEFKHHDTCLSSDSHNYLYIQLSAMRWTEYEQSAKPCFVKGRCARVCFATHCSRAELHNFVSYFSPKAVFGFSNPYKMTDVPQCDSPIFVERKRRMDSKCRGGKERKMVVS